MFPLFVSITHENWIITSSWFLLINYQYISVTKKKINIFHWNMNVFCVCLCLIIFRTFTRQSDPWNTVDSLSDTNKSAISQQTLLSLADFLNWTSHLQPPAQRIFLQYKPLKKVHPLYTDEDYGGAARVINAVIGNSSVNHSVVCAFEHFLLLAFPPSELRIF